MAVEDDVDALYAADPDEFVAARQALAKRLKADGDRARAAEVAKLRRPTAAAWAVNQLARRHADELAQLVEAGEELRRAHERLLAGGRADATVASGRRRREAVSDLVERAAGILAGSGRAADAHREAVQATLDAASLDPSVGAEVVAGRLSAALDPPSGLGEGGLGEGGLGEGGLGEGELDWSPAAAASRPPAPSRRAPEPAAASKPPAKGARGPERDPEAEERAGRAAAERSRRADDKRRRAETARTAATRARDLADKAAAAADHADRERERLEAEVVQARLTANDSRRAARELREAAQEAERQAAALEKDAGA